MKIYFHSDRATLLLYKWRNHFYISKYTLSNDFCKSGSEILAYRRALRGG